jgi:hypothetical protein
VLASETQKPPVNLELGLGGTSLAHELFINMYVCRHDDVVQSAEYTPHTTGHPSVTNHVVIGRVHVHMPHTTAPPLCDQPCGNRQSTSHNCPGHRGARQLYVDMVGHRGAGQLYVVCTLLITTRLVTEGWSTSHNCPTPL